MPRSPPSTSPTAAFLLAPLDVDDPITALPSCSAATLRAMETRCPPDTTVVHLMARLMLLRTRHMRAREHSALCVRAMQELGASECDAVALVEVLLGKAATLSPSYLRD